MPLSLCSSLLLLPPVQVLQLAWYAQFMLYRFSSQECLHCLHPSLIGLISYSALSSPIGMLQSFLAQLVFSYFDT
jgi:hypothetical protein